MFARIRSAQAAHAFRAFSTSAGTLKSGKRLGITAIAATAATASLAFTISTVHNDAPNSGETPKDIPRASNIKTSSASLEEDSNLNTYVWGSNSFHVVSSSDVPADTLKSPRICPEFAGTALRALAIHEQHAACVDAKGDLYQWGDGFHGTPSGSADARGPKLTLKGKNISQIAVTAHKVFALSEATGKIYVVSSSSERQNTSFPDLSPSSSPWWGTGWLWGDEQTISFAELKVQPKMGHKEKIISISAGRDHLLALTSAGRTLSHPITKLANSHGQLGFRKITLPDQSHVHAPRINVELTPRALADPYATASRLSRSSPPSPPPNIPGDDKSIYFSDTLFEIPALKDVKVAQAVAGDRSSFIRTEDEGRVLAWGANEYGQLGLGATIAGECVPVPSEVILTRSYPAGTVAKCVNITAGGDTTYFTVDRRTRDERPAVDLLACGMGQWGGLGNALYSQAQGTPVRVKSVSGIEEYSEATQSLQPLIPHALSVSPTPSSHAFLTLDTLARSGPGGSTGRDIYAWGHNSSYQLGNGKRSHSPIPMNIGPLSETDASGRLMLKVKTADVKDLQGKPWKKGVKVEQCAVAGSGVSFIFWKIVS